MNFENSRKKPIKKFKKKILVVFLLVALIPIVTVFASNTYLVIKNRQQTIVEQQLLAVDNANEKITKYFQEKIQGLNLVISVPIGSMWQVDAKTLESLLDYSLEKSKPIRLEFIDQQGKMLAKIDPDGRYSYNREYIAQFGTSTQYLPKNFNTFGSVEADVALSADFAGAKDLNSYYGLLEEVDLDPNDKEKDWVMRIASQIQNQNKEFIGVVSAEINVNEIKNLISGITLGSNGFVYVVDKNGYLIASGNPGISKINSSMRDNEVVHKITSIAGLPMQFRTYLSPINETVSWVAAQLDDEANNSDVDWYIISEWPVIDAFSVLQNLFFWSSFIALAIFLLVFIFAIIFSGTITKPIGKLTKGASQIKEGNLKYKLDLKTGDEFEILGNQFNEMIKVLKENQQLRDEFVFIAAHELRTPVTAIRGYVQMILDGSFGNVSDTVKENLKIVEKANDNLVELVNNLLEIARSEAGKMKIEMIDIDLNDRINTVIIQLASLAREKGIKVEFKPLREKEMIKADPGKLNEVLVNILGNAIKYTLGNGGVNIWQEDKGDHIVTHFKDHGIGMTEEELSKLFGKFYRAQNSETADIQGTGLGLFVTKEIIERMGGEISVKSKKGEGSTFSFSSKKAGNNAGPEKVDKAPTAG